MNFTIRAFVGDSRVSTAISYNKENKNYMFQSFPEKKKFGSLRGWMMHYTKLNPATAFKMEPSTSTPKPVLVDNPTQALIRKYYTAFGFQNTITPRSHCITQTPLHVFTNGNFLPVFFNRQTGMVRIGAQNSVSQLTDLDSCKFFVKRNLYDFQPVTLPVTSEPKVGQPVIAFSHPKHATTFNYVPNVNEMKKLFTAAGYFVKEFYVNNYKNETEKLNAIWSTPGIRAVAQPGWWYSSQEVVMWTSRTTNSRVRLNEWLAANPVQPSTPVPVESYPPLPSSPPSTTV